MAERRMILEKIKEIRDADERPKPDRSTTRFDNPLGVFDRPATAPTPAPQPPPPEPQRRPEAALQLGESTTPSQPPSEGPQVSQPVAPSLPPEEIERRSRQLFEIAERIVMLRRAWVTNPFSFEIDQEAEAWLARLQQIASTMPREAAERALGKYSGYLDQPVRTVKRPQIPEQVQELLLPPSAPSGRSAEWKSELYWEVRSMKREPKPVRPVGYVPDGLQSWVS